MPKKIQTQDNLKLVPTTAPRRRRTDRTDTELPSLKVGTHETARKARSKTKARANAVGLATLTRAARKPTREANAASREAPWPPGPDNSASGLEPDRFAHEPNYFDPDVDSDLAAYYFEPDDSDLVPAYELEPCGVDLEQPDHFAPQAEAQHRALIGGGGTPIPVA